MGNNRFLYLLVLGCCAAFYLLYSKWFSWYLLVLVILLPPFDLLVSLPGMLSRRIIISAPYLINQGESQELTVSIRRTRPYAAGGYKSRLSERGEYHLLRHKLRWGGPLGERTKRAIDTSHTGFTRFSVNRVWVGSLLGFFYLPLPMRERAGVLILPEPVMPPGTVALPRGNTLVPKPGGGFSEEHDIRPYRQGEPVANVHWKLTAKHDSLMLREALMRPAQSRLVSCEVWGSARERDLILGRLRWVSEYLLEHDCPHYVQLGQSGDIAEITSGGELVSYLIRVLDDRNNEEAKKQKLPTRFAWVFQVDAK